MEYERAIDKILKLFEITKFATLATADKNRIVHACQMCLINDGLTIYMQTDKTFEKIKNITENPHVAINIGAYNFKGIATVIGHPMENTLFIEKLKTKHPETFEQYTKISSEVLIKIDLTECRIWGVDNGESIHNQASMQILNFKNKNIRIYYMQ
ncbi:MAG: pyridoxamine 5'-phosphate oxidase family protein [Rickettsiales bacterium]|jgi:general stress protein 26|nr:pyridoxamine 5'-phosphate oxidase family protein [Rickettsiales bacterium]